MSIEYNKCKSNGHKQHKGCVITKCILCGSDFKADRKVLINFFSICRKCNKR